MLTPTSRPAVDEREPLADPSMLILQLAIAVVAGGAAILLAFVR